MKENLKIAVARLYYFEDKNQNEIASELKKFHVPMYPNCWSKQEKRN